MKKYLITFFFVLFSFQAFASPLDNTLFSDFIHALDSRKASFQQTKYIQELDASFDSSGIIYFKRNEGLVFNQKEPESLIFVTTKENYCIQNEKHELSELPYFSKIKNLIDAVLNGNWKPVEDVFDMQYSQSSNIWRVGFIASNGDIKKFIKQVNFTGTITDLSEIEILYTNGIKIIIKLTPMQKEKTDEINC